jgi:hypothetical protein
MIILHKSNGYYGHAITVDYMNSCRYWEGSRVFLVGLDQHRDRNYSVAEVQRICVNVTDKGCRVRIHGLVSAKELNDKEGVVVVPPASKNERVGVKVDRTGTDGPKLLKPCNLLPLDPGLTVKLKSGVEMSIKVHQGLPVQIQATQLRSPSGGRLHASDMNVHHLLDGLLWHCNILTGKVSAPFDPSHIAKLRETVEGRRTLRMLAEDCATNWRQVLGGLCTWAQSRPADKPALPFISDLNEQTDVVYWPQTGISGVFWVCKQRSDGALLIQKGNEVNGAIFCVLGLHCNLSSLNALGAMPFAVACTLLPYKGRIIHNNVADPTPDGCLLYPSSIMAKALEDRVALEAPLISLPISPAGADAVTAFAAVDAWKKAMQAD